MLNSYFWHLSKLDQTPRLVSQATLFLPGLDLQTKFSHYQNIWPDQTKAGNFKTMSVIIPSMIHKINLIERAAICVLA